MQRLQTNLRIGVVQLSPKIGQVQANLAKARELCKKIQPKSLDILCFPEMAFSGYVFENASEIRPHLEQPHTGATSMFCSDLAKKLQCYVLAGYPEKLPQDELDALKSEPKKEYDDCPDVEQIGANSAVFYSPDGEWVGAYRKTHLFSTDKSWAKAGNGFTSFSLPDPLRTMSLGICMDLNPQIPDWTVETGPYEIADYCLTKKTNVLVLLNAWLDSGKEVEEANDWSTLNYWAARLRPLWAKSDDDSKTGPEEDQKEIVVVVCNRSGEENGKTFAGTSAIFSMTRGSGRPKLLDMMERKEEGVRIWNIHV